MPIRRAQTANSQAGGYLSDACRDFGWRKPSDALTSLSSSRGGRARIPAVAGAASVPRRCRIGLASGRRFSDAIWYSGLTAAVVTAAAAYTYQSSMSQLATAQAASAAIRMVGKHAVVVGGTSGIGHGIALRLAQAGCSVTVVGRSASRGGAIVESLATTTPEQKHAFERLDAFSLKACGTLADTLGAKPLDLLVLTQGMATLQKHTPVAETGLDQKLTLHVYSRALLAKALAPALARSADGRVLSVLSAGVHGSYEAHRTSPELLKGYTTKNAADAAGFYTDAYLDSLSAEHPKVCTPPR